MGTVDPDQADEKDVNEAGADGSDSENDEDESLDDHGRSRLAFVQLLSAKVGN